MKKITKDDNFLDLVPVRQDKFRWKDLDNGNVQILIDRNSFLERAVRLIVKTPEVMKIDLDSHGSFIWNSMNGERTIFEIGELVKEKFGEEMEPLYERLSQYINILRNNKFIRLER